MSLKDLHRMALYEVQDFLDDPAVHGASALELIEAYRLGIFAAARLENAAVGVRVIARRTVYESPGKDFGAPELDASKPRSPVIAEDHIHAEKGDTGVIIHVEDDGWPTVRFERTGTATMVTPREVKVQLSRVEQKEEQRLFQSKT